MNREETARILDLIRAHYWQTLKTGENDRALMLETWAMALADVPLTPHIERALEWWFTHEQWPPQASQLRERARNAMREETSSRTNTTFLARSASDREKRLSPGKMEEYRAWRDKKLVGSGSATSDRSDTRTANTTRTPAG